MQHQIKFSAFKKFKTEDGNDIRTHDCNMREVTIRKELTEHGRHPKEGRVRFSGGLGIKTGL